MHRSTMVVAAVAGLACQTLEPPAREPSYPFTDFTTGQLVFRWTADRLPVRYFVTPGSEAILNDVRDAIQLWERELLFGEFRGAVTNDSGSADVILRVVSRNDVNPPFPCRGITAFAVDGTRLAQPFAVTVTWQESSTAAEVAACLRRVTIHEIGHTLGLFAHSDDPADIMASNPTVQALSLRDRRTLEILYHTTPDLGPPLEEVSP